MLDFSGVHWLEGSSKSYIEEWKKKNDIRQVDHEDIFEAFDIASGKSAGDNRLEFLKRGNIRISPEAPGIDIAVEPTSEQYEVIRNFLKENPYNVEGFYVDIEGETKRAEKLVYNGKVNAERVINDIKYYYNKGIAREQSEIMKFHNSDYDMKYSFRGENSALRNTNLDVAKQMDELGIDSEKIRLATGWFKSYDGKWRYEINDSKATLKLPSLIEKEKNKARAKLEKLKKDYSEGKIGRVAYNNKLALYNYEAESSTIETRYKQKTFLLGDILKHKELYEAYPEFVDIDVRFYHFTDGTLGQTSGALSDIVLNDKYLINSKGMLSTLIHEIQHQIQSVEGFGRGSNTREAEGDIQEEDIERKRKFRDEMLNPARDRLDEYVDSYLKKHFPRDIELHKLYGGTYSNGLLNAILYYKDSALYENYEGMKEAQNNAKKYKRYDEALFRKIDEMVVDIIYLTDKYNALTSKETPFHRYQRVAGEIEARDVQSRINMSKAERKATRPDIDRTDAIVKYSDRILHNSNDDMKYSFRGENAILDASEIDTLNVAKRMEKDGVSEKEIYAKTGWFKRSDGKWRNEIEDEIMHKGNFDANGLQSVKKRLYEDSIKETEKSYKNGEISEKVFNRLVEFSKTFLEDYKSGKLDTFLHAPKLYKNYPKLLKVTLFFEDINGYAIGYSDVSRNMIVIDKNKSKEAKVSIESVLAHEIQHFIQSYEGFSEGTSVEKAGDFDAYLNAPGEVEAREVEKRLNMTSAERANTIPKMYSDRILMGTEFSGGGMLEAGLLYKMIEKEFAVEWDEKIATVYSDNWGDHIYAGKDNGDVLKFDISKHKKDLFYFHASPVCHNFSSAKQKRVESPLDIASARKVAHDLEVARPQVFTVENAPAYLNSKSLQIIVDKLVELGYEYDVNVYNAADYGSATSRERCILRAVKTGTLPSKPNKVEHDNSWDKVTSKYWDSLKNAKARDGKAIADFMISAIRNTKKLQKYLNADGTISVDKPLLIISTTTRHEVTFAEYGELCPTLTTKCGEGKLILPGEHISFKKPNNNIKQVSPEFMGAIQGLEGYKYGKADTRAFTIIGNGIPTHLTKAVVGGLLESAYQQTHDGEKLYSQRNTSVPTFYSHMSKVIDGIKTEKVGANSIIPYLKGKGVKDEEIKWSGIQTFLEGKKSVTKAELQEFAKGSMLQIEEKTLSSTGEQGYRDSDTNKLLTKAELKEQMDRYAEENDYDYEVESYHDYIQIYFFEKGSDNEAVEVIEISKENVGDTKWGDYKLAGGSNYREILFKMPNSDYSNQAMGTHWGEEKGVLAHARLQDFETPNGKMLFVEEIQSDWHNVGHEHGYKTTSKYKEVDINKQISDIRDRILQDDRLIKVFKRHQDTHGRFMEADYGKKQVASMIQYYAENNSKEMLFHILTNTKAEQKAVSDYYDEFRELVSLNDNYRVEFRENYDKAPDAPFKNGKYIEYVMKNLIRQAAENGYDSIGWTTGKMQEERWSDEYAEGYRIEYDQDIPKFMNKYGKQWGAKVEKVSIDEEDVWSVELTPTMKESVMTEGQPLYSNRAEWHTGMTNAEVTMLEKRANTEKNSNNKYLSDTDKWLLYNNGKNTYFAIYSLNDVDEKNGIMPTILYASKGNRAIQDDAIVKAITTRYGGISYGASANRGTRTLGRLFQRNWDVLVRNNVHGNAGVGTRSNKRDVNISIGNTQYRLRRAFRNCLENITEVSFTRRRGGIIPSVKTNSIKKSDRASMTIARIDSLIEDSGAGSRKDYAQKWITSINPSDFLKMTLGLKGQNREYFDNYPGDYGSTVNNYDFIEGGLKKSRQTPYLAINVNTGEVVGHEGRHRMRALEKQGISSAEIVIEFRDDENRIVKEKNGYKNPLEIIDSLKVYNQSGTGQSATLTNIIPLNNAFRNEVIQNYGDEDAEIVFSRRTPTEKRVSIVDALLPSAKNSREKNLLLKYKNGIEHISEWQDLLKGINAEIKELSFAEGKRDMTRLKTLQDKKSYYMDLINKYDKQLLNLESTETLKDLMKRESDLITRTLKAESKKAMSEQKAKYNMMYSMLKQEAKDKVAATRENFNRQEYLKRVEDDIKSMVNMALHPKGNDEINRIPDFIKQEVLGFVKSIDTSSKRLLKGGDATLKDNAWFNQAIKLGNVLANTRNEFYEPSLYVSYDFTRDIEALKKLIDEQTIVKDSDGKEITQPFTLNKMTSDQLHMLSRAIRQMKKAITDFNKLYQSERYKSVNAANVKFKSDMSKYSDYKQQGRTTEALKDFVFDKNMRPIFFFERLGEVGKEWFNQLVKGDDTLMKHTKQVKEFVESLDCAKEVNEWKNDLVEVKLSNDETFKATPLHLMGLYELSKRKEGLEALKKSGFRIGNFTRKVNKLGTKAEEVIVSDVKKFTDTDKDIIREALTERQIYIADKLQNYMATQGAEWGNEVTRIRFQEEMFKSLDYYPISRDGRLFDISFDKPSENASLYALMNASFTKELSENANQDVMIWNILDVFSNHISGMMQYNAYTLPILNIMKWLNARPDDNGRSVRSELVRVFGSKSSANPISNGSGYAIEMLTNIIKAYNGTEALGDTSDGAILGLFHKHTLTQIAWNISSWLQQPLAITRAALVIKPKYLFGGALSVGQYSQTVKEMEEHNGIAIRKRMGFYDVNVTNDITRIVNPSGDTLMSKISEAGLKGAEFFDNVTWANIWRACKLQVEAENPGLTGDEYWNKVNDLFNETIYKTQVVDSILTKTEWSRGKGVLKRYTSAFMSEPVATASVMNALIYKYNMELRTGKPKSEVFKKYKGEIASTIAIYCVSQILDAAVKSVISAYRDEDKDEEFWRDKFGGSFAQEVIDELVPFNKLPIFNTIYELFKTSLGKFTGWDINGFDQQKLIIQYQDSLNAALSTFGKMMRGENTNYTTWYGIYNLLKAVSSLTGLPIATASREVIDLWNHTVGVLFPDLKITKKESNKG